jgi:hypothetical protein
LAFSSVCVVTLVKPAAAETRTDARPAEARGALRACTRTPAKEEASVRADIGAVLLLHAPRENAQRHSGVV